MNEQNFNSNKIKVAEAFNKLLEGCQTLGADLLGDETAGGVGYPYKVCIDFEKNGKYYELAIEADAIMEDLEGYQIETDGMLNVTVTEIPTA